MYSPAKYQVSYGVQKSPQGPVTAAVKETYYTRNQAKELHGSKAFKPAAGPVQGSDLTLLRELHLSL